MSTGAHSPPARVLSSIPEERSGSDDDGDRIQLLRDAFTFRKLVLTDLQEHVPFIENDAQMALHAVIHSNLKTLCDLGACGPFYRVSGLETESYPLYPTCLMGRSIGLTYWGSPHWGRPADRGAFPFQDSQTFKTNAWESMSWNSPNGVVAMTFPVAYGVEFYHPAYNKFAYRDADNRCERILIVAKGYFREYTPMVSGSELHETHGGDTMVSFLIPERFMHCITWRGARLDFGMTCLNCLNVLEDNEFAIELGGQTFALSMEIFRAKQERDTIASSWPPVSRTVAGS